MRPTRSATIAGMFFLAACSGSSGGTESEPTNEASETAEASPSALDATPPPASFAAGTYGRTVKFEGNLDGRWQLVLGTDGRYRFVSPQDTIEGVYRVIASGLLMTDPECGEGAYTFTKTANGLSFVDNGADSCEDRHALLAGQEWSKAP